MSGSIIKGPSAPDTSFDFGLFVNFSSEYSTNLINQPGFYQESHDKINASFSLSGANEKWKVSLIGNNLNDEITVANCFNSNSQNGVFFGGQIQGGPAARSCRQRRIELSFGTRARDLGSRVDEIRGYVDVTRNRWRFKMTAYVMIVRKETRDESKFARYFELAPLARADGVKFVAKNSEFEVLEGAPIETAVLQSFPDMAAARKWYRSDEYQAAVVAIALPVPIISRC